MLGWAGLRGATPIWLATFPVVAGVGAGERALRDRLLRRRHLDPGPGRDLRAAGDAARADHRRAGAAAAPARVGADPPHGRRRRLLPPAPGAAAAGPPGARAGAAARGAGQRDRPRRPAIPPRGSTELREGDELHILVRGELRDEVEELTERWHEGPLGERRRRCCRRARRLAGVHACARQRRPRRPLEADGDRRDPGASRVLRSRARRAAPWSPSPTAATRSPATAWSASADAGRWPAGASAVRAAARPGGAGWWQEASAPDRAGLSIGDCVRSARTSGDLAACCVRAASVLEVRSAPAAAAMAV